MQLVAEVAITAENVANSTLKEICVKGDNTIILRHRVEGSTVRQSTQGSRQSHSGTDRT